jgi:steroid delta-isomerase-like uncharacterized protein
VGTPAPAAVSAAKPDDTVSQNKAVCAKMVSAINAQNIQDFGAVLDAKFVDHSPAPGYTPDKEGTVKMFADFFAGFPDIHCNVELVVAEGDTVVMKWTTTATNTGPFMGAPATNQPFSIVEVHILKVKDGKITEHTRAMIPQMSPKKP